MNGSDSTTPTNFIKNIIDEDLKNKKNNSRVHTRFPPEPNGYLHIGHAKSICLNFGLANDYNGLCNLRFDDTNPSKEETEFVESIQEDVRWLGFDWDDRRFFASDYFENLYQYATQLIEKGKAFVDELTPEEMREYRGNLTKPGKESPYRNRSVEENLDLFKRMRAGEFADGSRTLRAKIDMASSNMNMRDPVIYRIQKMHHHRTGDDWPIYPMYDFAHGLSDSLEGITHSICTLEFEDHRPLYDWLIEQLEIFHPQQIEFARLNITFTVLSKRRLQKLVAEKHVNGWDDPRMPSLAGMRRRGYTAKAIRDLCESIGVTKSDSMVSFTQLEHHLREDLNKISPRVMAVLDPLKLVITNYPDGQSEMIEADNNPEDENAGKREVPFSKVLYIERNDFMEDAPRKYFRLTPGREVRLKHAYYVTCTDFVKDDAGNITEVHCTYDPETKGGGSPDGRKVRGTIQWVSAEHALDAEVRLYDHLFAVPNPNVTAEGQDFTDHINPNSLTVNANCKIEPSVADANAGDHFQFIRTGYFNIDKDSRKNALVFNRTVAMRDSWAKIEKQMMQGK